MRIVQIGDIHISDNRIKEFEILLEQLAESVNSKNPDLIIFTGDMFINRDKLSPKQVELARKFFKQDLKECEKILITGNHDVSMSTAKINSLSAIFTSDSINIFTKIKEYKDIGNYRFHFFPYPSKEEMTRLGIDDISKVYGMEELYKDWEIDKEKKNILIYHGTLEGFLVSDNYEASESSFFVGKDLIIPKSFWGQFNAVLAGHLHSYQTLDKAVYSGVPFPLNFADNPITGYVLWENLFPSFIGLDQKYPYITIDIGNLSSHIDTINEEAERRIKNDLSYLDTRVKIKYTVYSTQAGIVEHTRLSKYFKDAKEIRIVPEYREDKASDKVISFEKFKQHSIYEMILTYIDEKRYPPDVKIVAREIEDRIIESGSDEEGRGIHFKLDSLNLSNFKCFGEVNEVIDFNKLSETIGIFGDNKSGKSSLIESIIWALFGFTLRNKEVKSVIRNGEKTATVSLKFTSYNQRYRIDRVRNIYNSSLNLFCLIDDTWKDISGATTAVTQKSIEKLVGTFDIFVSTIYSPQNNIDLLIQKKPSERKQIILDCLQIDVLIKRQEEIAELKKEIRDEINQIKGKLSNYGDQLQLLIKSDPSGRQKSFEDLLRNEKINQSKFQNKIISFSKKVLEYEELEEDMNKITGKIDSHRKKIEEITDRIDEKNKEKQKLEEILIDRSILDEKLQRIGDLERELKRYSDEQKVTFERKRDRDLLINERNKIIEESKKKTNILKESKDSIMKSIRGFRTLDCSKPDCPLNQKVKDQVNMRYSELEKLDEQIAVENSIFRHDFETCNSKKEVLDKEIANSFYDFGAHMKYVKALETEQRNKWEELKYKIMSGEDILSNILELIGAFSVQRRELQDERNELIDKRTNIVLKIESTSKYQKEIDNTKVGLENVNRTIMAYEGQVYRCKKDLEDIQTTQKNITIIQEEMEEKENRLLSCSKYAEIVSKTGVIYSIVDKSIPIIEKFAQDILLETTNGMLNIVLDSHKVLSGGTKSDEVMIQFTDSKGKRDILEASGSESVLISLALRAAMTYLLSLRMGSVVELFIIDEGLGAFDTKNLESVKELLQKLGKRFNKLLFITHVEEAKSVAKDTIKITSNGFISSYEIVYGSNA